MTLVSDSLPNLINGVSQQPYSLRLASQCELQENGLSSVVDGLLKRPPSEFRAWVKDFGAGPVYAHTINRDRVERYHVLISNRNLRVFDLDGTERTVNFPKGKDYLTTSDARIDIRALTVADYTFILNTQKVCRKDPVEKVPLRKPEAVFWVRQGAYSTTYTVTVDGVKSEFKTSKDNVDQIATDYIATQLASGLSSLNSKLNIRRDGSIVIITGKSHADDFSISCSDGLGDVAIRLAKGTVQKFTELPARAPDGFTVKVQGDQTNGFDAYYVTFQTEEGSTEGIWKEGVKPGELNALNNETLPWTLVREANGTFTFCPVEWGKRLSGDLDIVGWPSFEGRTINDVFFYRNRLGFLSDENLILSRNGDFFEFFPASVQQTLDSDPVDVAASDVKVSILRHAIPWNQTLFLFSDQTQFVLGETELLTPKTVAINKATEYECSLDARPVVSGHNIYFSTNRSGYTAVQEYYVDEAATSYNARDITAHVPRYVAPDVSKLEASSNESVLLALSQAERNKLFVYSTNWNGNEKIQSSWSTWKFGATDEILNASLIESTVHIFIRRGADVFFEIIRLNTSDTVGRPLLDCLVSASQIISTQYDAVAGVTTITLPFRASFMGELQVIADEETQDYGKGASVVIKSTEARDDAIRLQVHGEVGKCFVGRPYRFRYRFSTIILRENAAGGGRVAVTDGRLQLRKMLLTYANSGYFCVRVTPKGRETYTYTFTGRVLGSLDNKIGVESIESGDFSFPLVSKNDQVTIEIENDTHLPCAFLSAGWEGLYVTRSRRL